MSNSGLYGNVSNVTVTSNNVTTLYNARASTVKTGIVPGRNFTTLYTNQTEISPTKSYSNANVEAFLNVGSDFQGNEVDNIVLHGNITVGQNSYLGSPSQVKITGGNLNYVLQTDGGANLSWVPMAGEGGNSVVYVHFDVSSTGNNQSFTDSELSKYQSNITMNVMKNGVNIEPSQYTLSGATLTVNIELNSGDTIDVLATGSGGNLTPGGNLTEVQYNGGVVLSGNSSFTFDQVNAQLNVTNLKLTGNSELGSLSNVHISGGTNGQVLTTDGSGDLSWTTVTVNPAGSNTQIQYNHNGSFGANSMFTFNDVTEVLSVPNVHISTDANITGNINILGNINMPTTYLANGILAPLTGNHVTVSDSTQSKGLYVDDASVYIYNNGNNFNFAGNGTLTVPGNISSINANLGNLVVANYFTGTLTTNSQPNITSVGTLASLTVTGTITGNISGSSATAGTVTASSQPNISTVGTLTSLNATGNISSANYLLGNGAYITGLPAGYSNANVANYLPTYTGTLSPGNITGSGFLKVSNGVYSSNVYNGTYTDGIVVDYLNGNGRISVGSLDGINFYNSGVANVKLFGIDPNGNATSTGTLFAPQANITNVYSTYLHGDGSNVTGVVGTAGGVAGSVQYNDGNNLITGSSHLTFADTDFANSLPATLTIGQSTLTPTNYGTNLLLNGRNGNTTFLQNPSGGGLTITSTGANSNIQVTANTIGLNGNVSLVLQSAFETFTPNSTGASGNINLDVLTQSIIYNTNNATSNVTLNVRGNATTSLNAILPVNESVTVVFMNTVGSSVYYANTFQIDGSNITPKWIGGYGPTSGIVTANSIYSYTYTIMKTASSTYTVLGSMTEYS